jgi:hypothetical protein
MKREHSFVPLVFARYVLNFGCGMQESPRPGAAVLAGRQSYICFAANRLGRGPDPQGGDGMGMIHSNNSVASLPGFVRIEV